jgi:hypothetical protein
MAKRRTLSLSAEERSELEHVRAHDKRPYLREQAAALLKIADGTSVHAVALKGLLKRRKPDTVYGWLTHFEARRTLHIRPATRGRLSPR